MNNKFIKTGRELLWIITGLFCLVTAVHQTINEGFHKSYMFFILTIVSFAMYTLRRNLRIREQNRKPNE